MALQNLFVEECFIAHVASEPFAQLVDVIEMRGQSVFILETLSAKVATERQLIGMSGQMPVQISLASELPEANIAFENRTSFLRRFILLGVINRFVGFYLENGVICVDVVIKIEPLLKRLFANMANVSSCC